MPTQSNQFKEYDRLYQFAVVTSKSIEGLMRKNHLDRTTKAHIRKLLLETHSLQDRVKHVADIAEARADIAAGRTIPQEKLFKKLGL